MNLIGVDWSTDPRKVGLALARRDAQLMIESAELGRTRDSIIDTVTRWLDGAETALIAIDAPLGWPAALGVKLVAHKAGGALAGQANDLFHRETDRIIHEQVGVKPLEVGADRIARTARSALEFLDDLRTASGRPLPLAWTAKAINESSVIEVYPAATLKAHGLRHRGYKAADRAAERREIVDSIRGRADVGEYADLLAARDDALDAVVCTVAGADSLQGAAIPPTDLARAQHEGWMWVRRPRT